MKTDDLKIVDCSPLVFNVHGYEPSDAVDGEDLSGLELAMYRVIDDIDTYSDMAKSNYQMYQKLVMNRLKKFFGESLVHSDGYRVWKAASREVKR